jgi:hypothetical protein
MKTVFENKTIRVVEHDGGNSSVELKTGKIVVKNGTYPQARFVVKLDGKGLEISARAGKMSQTLYNTVCVR